MKVRDIMTKNVAYVGPSTPVVEAARLMQKHNVGSVPVMDDKGVAGIITDRDIAVRCVAHGKSPQDTPVSDVMTTHVITVTPDMNMDEVTEIMSAKQIRRVPVVENNKIVGIVALGDVAVNPRYDIEASDALAEISKPSRPENMQAN